MSATARRTITRSAPQTLSPRDSISSERSILRIEIDPGAEQLLPRRIAEPRDMPASPAQRREDVVERDRRQVGLEQDVGERGRGRGAERPHAEAGHRDDRGHREPGGSAPPIACSCGMPVALERGVVTEPIDDHQHDAIGERRRGRPRRWAVSATISDVNQTAATERISATATATTASELLTRGNAGRAIGDVGA